MTAMIKRKKTRTVKIGQLRMGSAHRVIIQSMTKLATTNVAGCVRQINKLIACGCDFVRLSVPTAADTRAFGRIVDRVSIPLAADVHFSSARAIEAIEAGAAKIRLNPGNITSRKDLIRIIDSAKHHKIAIRIGVNEASIRDLKKSDTAESKRVSLMLKELKSYVRFFEKHNFTNLVLSAKSSDTIRTIEINRKISAFFDYPVHLGLTHAGLPGDASIPSAVAIGSLLSEGIGDTIRVSAAGDPTLEIGIAHKILMSLNLACRRKPTLIVCPTCGRCEINLISFAKKIEKMITNFSPKLRIAVMGCVVNGPGEAADSDLAICAGKNKAYLYRSGQKIATVALADLLPTLKKHLSKLS